MTDPAVSIRTDRRFIRANGRSARFILARITAPSARVRAGRPPVNLAIVVDRSGSMSGAKLATAKRAVAEAIARLQPTDRFSVVVYDDKVDVVIASTPATGEALRAALERLEQIDARGSTDLGGGWLRGCEQVAGHLMDQGVNRCLLLTDGLANVGITDPAELATHAAELRARGVSTSTFGVGNDFDERLLADLADAGGGHFYYISDVAQIRDAITSEVGETLEVVARDVALEVLARDEIEVEVITPHKVARRGGRSVVQLGDLGSEQVVEAVLRLTFPYGTVGHDAGAILSITDRDGVFGTEPHARLTWAYADTVTNDQQPRDREVDRVVARMFAARATQEAVRLNREGDYRRAGDLLAATAARIRSYAGSDPELRALVDELTARHVVMEAPVPEYERKQMHYASANLARSRMPDGRSIRSEKRV
jgi:Ca-activated chloride channel family protein